LFAVVEAQNLQDAIAALITIIISPFYGHSYAPCIVERSGNPTSERKYRAIMMMVLFRIGLATFYIGFFEHLLLSAGRFLCFNPCRFCIYLSQRNYTVNTLN
jgi:CPA2 family monovalent cation:H+ antiporter-2